MFVTPTRASARAQADELPGHYVLYGMSRHSYRDLPVRFAEPGLLHRNEPSGTIHGLLRARHFAQDDGHIFATEEQVQSEVAGCLELARSVYGLFDFDTTLELSTRPERRIGDDAPWDRAEKRSSRRSSRRGCRRRMNPGDGAFYGPKIDITSWTRSALAAVATIQLDYQLPRALRPQLHGRRNSEERPSSSIARSSARWSASSASCPRARRRVAVLALAGQADRSADLRAPGRGRARGVLGARRGGPARRARRPQRVRRAQDRRDAELRRIPRMLIIGEREAAAGAWRCASTRAGIAAR